MLAEETKQTVFRTNTFSFKRAISSFSKCGCKRCNFNDKEIQFKIPKDALGLEDLLQPIEEQLTRFGLEFQVKLVRDEEQSVKAEIDAMQKEIEETLSQQKKEAEAVQKINEQMQKEKKYTKISKPTDISFIKDIPNSQNEISIYQNTNGPAIFVIDAYILI